MWHFGMATQEIRNPKHEIQNNRRRDFLALPDAKVNAADVLNI
jgi:hypothetical protein